MKINKKSAIYGVLSLGIAILVFVGYRVLFMAGVSEYAKEFIAGCLGAVITILATAALLKSQTDTEIRKDQLSEIFKEKLKIYTEFISFLNGINNDGELTHEELKTLVEWGCRLSLVCRPGVVRAIYEYTFQVIAFGSSSYSDLSAQQKRKWNTWMKSQYEGMESEFNDEAFCESHYGGISKIISYLREDMASKKISDVEENIDIQETISDLISLHSAAEISIEENGEIIITAVFYEEDPKRVGKKPSGIRGNGKKIEA